MEQLDVVDKRRILLITKYYVMNFIFTKITAYGQPHFDVIYFGDLKWQHVKMRTNIIFSVMQDRSLRIPYVVWFSPFYPPEKQKGAIAMSLDDWRLRRRRCRRRRRRHRPYSTRRTW